MGFMNPEQVWRQTVEAGEKKVYLPILNQLVLGFLGGAYISIGFLLYIRVSAVVPAPWSDFGSILGAACFPLGLILTLIAGGELLTGNMMAVPAAYFSGRIGLRQLMGNWLVITLGNFVGALFIAYAFGHLVGLTEHGIYLDKLMKVVHAKIAEPFYVAILSGIGCNWLVGLAVWLAYGAEEGIAKLVGIWLPTMAFVAIGFQHVVANMFVIPAAIFAGQATWMDYLSNFIPVYIGNALGGTVFVAGMYAMVYRKSQSSMQAKSLESKSAPYGK
ncbi:formate/nitrite transporter [Paenibacillus baekrokdamisoli]|uniref:Formate/nitrite transporter n=1 Tax=Paenibacillus baekrokdamisoli TaxID=1712516 RepID=A0A3G9J2Q8_9BACL|nr:formate/nitrite transporter family protein [Paenibacillus baekrokdamisoli]MBB3072269.1 formate/nitrite transporter [Paenibacillus baekrokdamisoli]BBH24852.1 formate/nitrite transporter [Paenibacillus baekrokdamisoli]